MSNLATKYGMGEPNFDPRDFAREKSILMSCIAVCGARYKTRPGLSYHYNHTHKEPGSSSNSSTIPPLEEQEQEQQTSSSLGGGSITPPSTPGGILQELTPEMIPGALASSGAAIRLMQFTFLKNPLYYYFAYKSIRKNS